LNLKAVAGVEAGWAAGNDAIANRASIAKQKYR
jgi:hypothetical protein